MDMMEYTHFTIVQQKKQEISVLRNINLSLMRDHCQKDHEMDNLRKKNIALKRENKELARVLAEDEYGAREWVIEKKQLLEELERLRGTHEQVSEDYFSETDSEGSILDLEDEEEEHGRRKGLQRTLSFSMSVRDLVQDIEADIEKHKEFLEAKNALLQSKKTGRNSA